jgi:hypothetical protein
MYVDDGPLIIAPSQREGHQAQVAIDACETATSELHIVAQIGGIRIARSVQSRPRAEFAVISVATLLAANLRETATRHILSQSMCRQTDISAISLGLTVSDVQCRSSQKHVTDSQKVLKRIIRHYQRGPRNLEVVTVDDMSSLYRSNLHCTGIRVLECKNI